MIAPVMLSDEDIRIRPAAWASPGLALSDDAIVLSEPRLSTSRVETRWLEAAVEQQLSPLRSLAEGWDTYGAPSIDIEAIRGAESLLVSLSAARLPLPYVVPTSKGGVALEWHRGALELLIEIYPGGAEPAAYFADDETGEEWDQPLSASEERLIAALIRMTH